MRRTLQGNLSWKAKKNLCGETILLKDMSEPKDLDLPILNFSTVIFDNCDKNYVHDNLILHKKIFPSMKKLVLASHPCQYSNMKDLSQTGVKIFVHERYWNYMLRWKFAFGLRLDNVSRLSSIDYFRIVHEKQ